MIAEGDVLHERYRLDRSVGRGGFAAVYLATDLLLGRRVAVKALHPALVAPGVEHDFLTQFAEEAQAVAALDHPNILAVHDYGRVGGTPYLVMPYVAGGSLHDLLRRERRLPAARVAAYLAQAAAALDYAHRRGLVHRDVKPQNFLVGEGDRLLLADFGIAKVLGAAGALDYTKVMGTPAYMAPEQFDGKVGPGSDTYALGCVAFQLLTGGPPYTGETSQVVKGHLLAPVPSLEERSGGQAPPLLQPVVERALAKEPAGRFNTAGEFARAFQRQVALPLPPGVPVRASPRATLTGHVRVVVTVAWSPSGRTLASGGHDKTVRLWRADGSPLATLAGHEESVERLAWSPDGQVLASASRDASARLWSASGEALGTLTRRGSAVWALAWSPDGGLLATGSEGGAVHGGTVRVWRRDGALEATLRGHTQAITRVAWSPDGGLLASASRDGTVRLWGAAGAPPQVLAGHTSAVHTIAWSPDGSRLASGSGFGDHTVRVWDRSGRALATLAGHTAAVFALAWSPDGALLASGADDATVRLWHASGGSVVCAGYGDVVRHLAWRAQGDLLATTSWDHTVRLWRRDGQVVAVLAGHAGRVTTVAWSPDGTTLASASADKVVCLWR